MKHARGSRTNNDWAARQLQGTATRPPAWAGERREYADRRRRHWWAIWYGSFHPRRRRPARRLDDSRFHLLDWYSAHLLAVSVAILLLSATDAFFTGMLLLNGADELNPLMATALYRGVATFTALKMAMTGAGVVLMVFLARYRFMRLIRVELVLYAVLVVYLWLIGYEIWMLKAASAA
jgi:hypothetical protein